MIPFFIDLNSDSGNIFLGINPPKEKSMKTKQKKTGEELTSSKIYSICMDAFEESDKWYNMTDHNDPSGKCPEVGLYSYILWEKFLKDHPKFAEEASAEEKFFHRLLLTCGMWFQHWYGHRWLVKNYGMEVADQFAELGFDYKDPITIKELREVAHGLVIEMGDYLKEKKEKLAA